MKKLQQKSKLLHKSIIKDKTITTKSRHHRKIEEDYEKLRQEINELKSKKGSQHYKYVKRLHKKAKTLHKKTIKHNHPLQEGLKNIVNGLGSMVSKSVKWIKDKSLQKKVNKDKSNDGAITDEGIKYYPEKSNKITKKSNGTETSDTINPSTGYPYEFD